MKKKIVFWIIMTVIVMVFFPWLAITFVPSESGMAAFMLLFLVIDPIYSIIIGAFAGKDIKNRWYLPIISPLLFLAGTWIFLDMGNSDFLIYTAAYVIMGLAAMIVSMLIHKKRQSISDFSHHTERRS